VAALTEMDGCIGFAYGIDSINRIYFDTVAAYIRGFQICRGPTMTTNQNAFAFWLDTLAALAAAF
jgi:hypothetical protein